MSNILFISERAIKDCSILEENLESKIIRITIKEVQQLDLLPIVGDDKYEQIESEIKSKSEDPAYVIDENIRLLLDRYIKDFLVYGVLLNISTALTYKATNKGFMTMSDNNGNVNKGNDIESVKRYYRSKYDAYRLRLIEYVDKSCGAPKQVAPFSTGWYLTDSPNIADLYKKSANKTGGGWRL